MDGTKQRLVHTHFHDGPLYDQLLDALTQRRLADLARKMTSQRTERRLHGASGQICDSKPSSMALARPETRAHTWPRVPREIRRRQRPRARELLLLREVARGRGRVRVGRGQEEPLERVDAAEVEEEEALEVERAHARGELVRERGQREAEEVRRDGHRELVQVVRRRERVELDGRDGRLCEDERVERRAGRDVPLCGDAILGECVECGDQCVDRG